MEKESVKTGTCGAEQSERVRPSPRVCGWHEGTGGILKIDDLISAYFHPLSPGDGAFSSKSYIVLCEGI